MEKGKKDRGERRQEPRNKHKMEPRAERKTSEARIHVCIPKRNACP